MFDSHKVLLTHADLSLDKAEVLLELWQMPSGHLIVQAAIDGYFGIGDLGRIFHLLHQEPGFDVSQPTLWDLRKFNFPAQDPRHFRASLFALQHFPKRRNTRRGILVTNQIGYGMTRMYQETAAMYQIENANVFKISYSRNLLMAWLCDT